MDRGNGRYTAYIRRQGQQQHSTHNSSSSSSSSSNNNQHYDNRNNSISSSSSQYSSSNNTNNSSPVYSSSHSAAIMTREPLSQHDELIRYIREAWTKVNEQGTPVLHCNESDHQLKNFKPFNLEEYWGQRLVQNIHVSHGGHQ